MSMTDPIADFLTRIRNAIHASHETVLMPASRQKAELARILAEQGYIDAYSVAAATEAPGDVLEIRHAGAELSGRWHVLQDFVAKSSTPVATEDAPDFSPASQAS